MKKIFCLVMFLTSIHFFSQSLNDYNKAIVPAKFHFQNEVNQYRVNSVIKTFLKQKGFEVYLDNETLPEGFMDYNCNKVFINAVTDNTLFTTKIKFEFKDCKGNILYATDLGESRVKDIAAAYNEATILALKSFEVKAYYKFSGKNYDDEEVEAKLKAKDKIEVSTIPANVVKNELFIKVMEKKSGTELLLYKVSKPDVFLTNFNGKLGVVIAKNGSWFFEYIENEKVESKPIDIKF